MDSGEFAVDLDGRHVFVSQAGQRVTIPDEGGNIAFRDQIQVAAGSIQSLFSVVDRVRTATRA